MAVNVTVAELRLAFPEFANTTTYPDAYIQRFITMASMFITKDSGRIKDDVRVLALEYMTCHLMTLSAVDGQGKAQGDGNGGAMIASAHIESVSVAFQTAIANNSFEQWIQSTPYGKMYWALLSANNPAGIYWVGSPRAFGIR